MQRYRWFLTTSSGSIILAEHREPEGRLSGKEILHCGTSLCVGAARAVWRDQKIQQGPLLRERFGRVFELGGYSNPLNKRNCSPNLFQKLENLLPGSGNQERRVRSIPLSIKNKVFLGLETCSWKHWTRHPSDWSLFPNKRLPCQ